MISITSIFLKFHLKKLFQRIFQQEVNLQDQLYFLWTENNDTSNLILNQKKRSVRTLFLKSFWKIFFAKYLEKKPTCMAMSTLYELKIVSSIIMFWMSKKGVWEPWFLERPIWLHPTMVQKQLGSFKYFRQNSLIYPCIFGFFVKVTIWGAPKIKVLKKLFSSLPEQI